MESPETIGQNTSISVNLLEFDDVAYRLQVSGSASQLCILCPPPTLLELESRTPNVLIFPWAPARRGYHRLCWQPGRVLSFITHALHSRHDDVVRGGNRLMSTSLQSSRCCWLYLLRKQPCPCLKGRLTQSKHSLVRSHRYSR